MKEHSKTETKNRLLAYESEGKEYIDIAKALNDEGHKTPSRGASWSEKTVSDYLRKWGRARRNTGPRRSRLPALAKSAAGVSKWDVLRSIDGCSDIGPTQKRALLEIVFCELNK